MKIVLVVFMILVLSIVGVAASLLPLFKCSRFLYDMEVSTLRRNLALLSSDIHAFQRPSHVEDF
jgi:hypothetical protein